MSNQIESRRSAHAIRAGGLIFLAGPPIGLLLTVVGIAGASPRAMTTILHELGILLSDPAFYLVRSYGLGGVQALIAAGIVGWKINAFGWIGLGYWAIGTALLAVTPIVLAMLTLFPDTDFLPILGVVFALPAVLASLVLRFLIIALGWMRKP